VLLINLGTPDQPDVPSVRRYLAEFLSDPEVIRLPRGLDWLNPALGRIISRFRAAPSAEKYRRIWHERGSPLRAIGRNQASALEATLPKGMRAFCAMRYGRPSIAETLESAEALGIEELVVVPMYPQYSGPTTRTAVREVYRLVHRLGCRIDLTIRGIWYDDSGYICAQARLIYEYAAAHGLTPDDCHLLFSAHSLPVSYVKHGDPYVDQITRTAELVTRRLGWPLDRASLGFQSRLGPVAWLGPSTTEVLRKLWRAGEKRLLVCPLSFTTDCLETLEEIGFRCREQYEKVGGEFHLCPALNASEPFIGALKNLVIHGRHPMTIAEAQARPLLKAQKMEVVPEQVPIESLVMVGMSLEARLGTGRGPHLRCADEERFRKAKRSQCDVPDILRTVTDGEDVREAFVWNTCRRFELYALLKDGFDQAERRRIVGRIRRLLFQNVEAESPTVNVLSGAEAWHHMLRTACGLNSTLPGERDVVEQLQAAHRLAQRAGTAGPSTDRLLAEVLDHQQALREETEWGRFDPDYCYATLGRIVKTTGLDLADCRCTVIGGSTTSCGILSTLAGRFEVSPRQLTLLHRGHSHGGHLKMLRKAIGHGRRIRVGSYSEKAVIQAIADSDVVFFGIDRREPVLQAEQIRDCRDFAQRPLTIFDFNLFSSTKGLESVEGIHLYEAKDLEAAAAAFAEEMSSSDQFARAVRSAETWILEHLPLTLPAAREPEILEPQEMALSGGNRELHAVEAHGDACSRPAGDNGRGASRGRPSRNTGLSRELLRDRPVVGGETPARRRCHSAGIGSELVTATKNSSVDLEMFRKYAGLSLPRHVSYPMPSWWHEIDAPEAEAMLRDTQAGRPVRDLSLYLHVPFCESQCKFCACTRITLSRGAAGSQRRVEAYVQAVQTEIGNLGRAVGQDRTVRQVHWGGGSPTYLAPAEIERICHSIRQAFDVADDAEVAIEIDPRRAPRSVLETLRRSGFNRVSMGVQDFDAQVQRHVGRYQPFSQVRETVDTCRDLGFTSINFDLIYGLPYQTLASVRETIDRTIALSPDRVAFYHYAQIPDQIATQRGMHHARMPDSQTKLEMFLAAAELFGQAGYEFIGLDHFAKPDEALAAALKEGTLQRTFQGMTTGGGLDLLGVGASSISHLGGVGFLQNTRDPDDYVRSIEGGECVARKGKRLSFDDCLRQMVMRQLYCLSEVRPETLEDSFGIDFGNYFSRELEVLKDLERDGLVTVADDCTLRITNPLGRVLLRNVAAVFDAYLSEDAFCVGDRHQFSANA
jgi:oxygen-independent coproporphyrinogen-3 oxidase